VGNPSHILRESLKYIDKSGETNTIKEVKTGIINE